MPIQWLTDFKNIERIFWRADGANQVSCMSNSCQPEKPNRAKSSQVGKGRDHDRIPREDIGASLDSWAAQTDVVQAPL